MHIVVMGVSGCGKTTARQSLAQALGGFIEGDRLHLPQSIGKMTRGVPLADEDRWQWLDRIAGQIATADQPLARGQPERRRLSADYDARDDEQRIDVSEVMAHAATGRLLSSRISHRTSPKLTFTAHPKSPPYCSELDLPRYSPGARFFGPVPELD